MTMSCSLSNTENSGKSKARKVRLLGTHADAPPTKTLKEFKQEVENLANVVNHTVASSSEDDFGPNVRTVDSRLLSIQTGSNAVFSQASTLSIVTDGGMTTCGDGGQNLERLFLENNPDRVRPRNYDSVQSVVKAVRADLNSDSTKIQSAATSKPFFIPCTALYSIMSQVTIGRLLRELYPGENLGVMNKEVLAPTQPGVPSFRRTFAILILIDKQADFRWFFQQNISDSELPFEFAEMNDSSSIYAKLDWEAQDFRNFCRARSEVAPVFFAVTDYDGNEKIVHFQCRSGEVLPFTRKNNLAVRAGFGEVSSYDLHEDQQNLHRYTRDGPNRAVAVKKLYRADKSKEFREEYATLDRLRHLSTPHIAKLLGAFEIPTGPESYDYFLMFECADFTLAEIWATEAKNWRLSSSLEEIARWVALQAFGLTKALEQLHNFKKYRSADDDDIATHGIHGDLKPENILHYKNWSGVDEDIGVLQITDFGLSSFHQTKSAEDIVLLRGTNAYRPPEAASSSPLSASFDTWSLGCVFLEFLTWLVRGPESLKLFRDKRLGSPGFALWSHPCFWELNEEDGSTILSLSTVVVEWVTELCEDSRSSDFVRDFCVLIVNRMLLIEEIERKAGPAEWVHNSRPTRRIMAKELAQKLEIFKEKGEGYFTSSVKKGFNEVLEMNNCIEIPKPLVRVKTEAAERAKILRGRVPK